MFSFGEQLYQLTERDYLTLMVDPIFRSANGTSAGGTNFGSAAIDIPEDRCLYLDTVTIEGSANAGQFWTSLRLGFTPPLGNTFQFWKIGSFGSNVPLVSNNSNVDCTGETLCVQISPKIILPPGTRRVNLNTSRAGTIAAAASNILTISGYFIPPGRLGRQT